MQENNLKFIDETKGYKDNVKLFSSIDLACNEVKNVIMNEIVFEGYTSTKTSLEKIVKKKVESIFEEVTPKIIENSKDSFEELYFHNEDEKVKWTLKNKKAVELGVKDVDKYVDEEYAKFQGYVEDARDNHVTILEKQFADIKKATIKKIVFDCYSLMKSQVPSKDIKKLEK